MRTRLLTLTGMLVIAGALATTLGACGDEGSGEGDPHCRIYLVHDSSGSFDALHVADSPAGGNWGPNLLDGPPEYLSDHPTWRVFRIEAGRVIDHRLVYTLGTAQNTKEEEGDSCNDGAGIKYEIARGVASGKPRLFITTFNFDH